MPDTATYWLSFIDQERRRNLGVCFVDVPVDRTPTDNIRAAIQESHRLGCNPGGEVLAIRLEEAATDRERLAATERGRLYSREELAALGWL